MLWGLAFTIIFILILRWLLKSWSRNEPPGPSGMPFFGVIHKIDPRGLQFSVTKWAEEYGDVIKFKMFGENFVALNSYDTIYDALVKRSNEFAGRPDSFRLETLRGHYDDVVSTNFSPRWLAMKKLMMQTLKMYGSNLLVLQEISSELIKEMIEEFNLAAESGEAFDPKPILHRCITRILASILYGRKMEEHAVREWLGFEIEISKLLNFSDISALLDKFPWMCYFPLGNVYKKFTDLYQALHKSLTAEINKSKNKYHPEDVKCFIDGLFKYKSSSEDNPTSYRLMDDELLILMGNMTSAGTMTTSMTLTVLVACLVNKPIVQDKMAKEIKSAIGDRIPCLEDRALLPYTEATLLEVLRFHTLVPLNLAHRTMSDVSIDGYKIPKDTTVFCNLWKLHHDPEFWDEPWEFKPERFLEDGSVVPTDHPNRKRVLAFGAGRRVCAGEVLAKNRMFLIVTSLLQHFEFLPESEQKRPSHDPRTYTFGMNLSPDPYKIRLSKRV